MNLRKERFLITGAGGFIGSCLTRRLTNMGITPHVILRGKADTWRLADIQHKLTVHEGDLNNEDFLTRLMTDLRPTVIYHLATHGAYPTQTDPKRIITTNVLGTLYLLQALKNIDYTLFVNTGSSSEYGFKNKPMEENDNAVPNSFYAIAKASQTMLCEYFARVQEKSIVTFRLFSVYGPYEEPTRLVPTLVRHCLQGKDLNMVSPNTSRDFIFVDDVVDAFLSIDVLRKQENGIFNIGSGQQTSLKEIVDCVLHLTQAKIQVHWDSMPRRIWDTNTWVGNISKASHLLDWKANTSLQKGLSSTIEWSRRYVKHY